GHYTIEQTTKTDRDAPQGVSIVLRSARIALLHLEDCELHHARGRLHRHLLARAFAEEGGADRRLVGDAALPGVGLGATDDHPGLLLALILKAHGHRAADAHLTVAMLVLVDRLGAGKQIFDLTDAALEERLRFLSVLI